MYQLYTSRFEGNNGVYKPPGFEYVQRMYQRDILNITNYFHSRVYSVKSNHFLCRVLNSSSAPMSYELDRYMEVLYTRSPYVAKFFRFTSEIDYGVIHDGIFYGEGCKEIILYNEEYFNPYEEYKNWKNIQAIRVLDHPISDLGLIIPNGNKNSTDEGLAVITINLPLLLLQYRGFVMEQYAKLKHGGVSLLGVAHFVNMYVLPNMLYSHSEIVILNRLCNLFYGAPMGTSLKKYPFPIIQYADKLDKNLLEVVKRLKDSKMWYQASLMNIPSFFKEDMQEVLLMPDFAKTRQVWWSMLISRLKVDKFLLDIGGVNGMHTNKTLYNRLKLDVMRIMNENMIAGLLPDDLYYDTNNTFSDILALDK
jgi:hypothetical protein